MDLFVVRGEASGPVPLGVLGRLDAALFRCPPVSIELVLPATLGASLPAARLRAFRLTAETTAPYPGAVCLHPEPADPANHKVHALRLLAAALELMRTAPHARCLLNQIDTLRELLVARTAGERRATSERFARVSTWLSTDSRLALDGPVSHYLAQAGFPITPTMDLVHADDRLVSALHCCLASSASAPTMLRKAG